MKASIDISLYPLNSDYIPAIQNFIDRIQLDPNVAVKRNDLTTQIYGDYDYVMDLLKVEVRHSWEVYGSGVFAVKILMGDLRGLSDEEI